MAMKLPSMVVSALATWDGKALAKGEKQIGGFSKKLKGFGAALGLAFSAKALINFGKNATKAFVESEKSAKRLEGIIKNVGLSLSTPLIESNLESISAKYGYQGEVLNEAYQKLLTSTGSLEKSQELLNLSLNISAGTGADLVSVNQDLASLYVGNTKVLKKYNLGLSNAQLKTLKYEDAVALLNKQFAGAAQSELTTYSGKMRVLGEAAGNAEEIIGKGLIDSLMILTGDTDIDGLARSMGDFAEEAASAATSIATLIKDLRSNTFIKAANMTASDVLTGRNYGEIFGLTPYKGSTLNPDKPNVGRARRFFAGGQDSILEAKRNKENAAAAAAALKLEKERLALANKQAKAEKNKIALTKAAAVFDTTRIGLAAALKATYDKDTKLRLEALMLIEEDRGDEALKKIDELAKFQKNADLERLAGVETISNATLQSLNTQLLTELKVINESKMAEGDKDLAREEAFKKYNAAITAAGKLMATEAYNERVQIQLTEIARIAALTNTYNANKALDLLKETEEISMIDRIAEAQSKADKARMDSLKNYLELLSRGGSAAFNELGPVGGLGAGAVAGVTPGYEPDLTVPSYPPLAPDPQYGWNPTMGPRGGDQINVTVNAGVGDPEAIARVIEDTLNQSTYRGTSTGRGTGNYIL